MLAIINYILSKVFSLNSLLSLIDLKQLYLAFKVISINLKDLYNFKSKESILNIIYRDTTLKELINNFYISINKIVYIELFIYIKYKENFIIQKDLAYQVKIFLYLFLQRVEDIRQFTLNTNSNNINTRYK